MGLIARVHGVEVDDSEIFFRPRVYLGSPTDLFIARPVSPLSPPNFTLP